MDSPESEKNKRISRDSKQAGRGKTGGKKAFTFCLSSPSSRLREFARSSLVFSPACFKITLSTVTVSFRGVTFSLNGLRVELLASLSLSQRPNIFVLSHDDTKSKLKRNEFLEKPLQIIIEKKAWKTTRVIAGVVFVFNFLSFYQHFCCL